MGDFLLDFRRRNRRREQAESLRFFPDMAMDRISRDSFTLFVTRTGRDQLWAPFESRDGIVIALVGRVALGKSEWEDGSRVEGSGGLACKAIYHAYRARGIEGLTGLSGGFAIHVYDPRQEIYHLVNDRGGAFPCYGAIASDEVICSHPDLLAEFIGGGRRFVGVHSGCLGPHFHGPVYFDWRSLISVFVLPTGRGPRFRLRA